MNKEGYDSDNVFFATIFSQLKQKSVEKPKRVKKISKKVVKSRITRTLKSRTPNTRGLIKATLEEFCLRDESDVEEVDLVS